MPSSSLRPASGRAIDAATLRAEFARIRSQSLSLASPLSAEDQCAQSMPDASPTKWHLAHTTWFFETFILCASPDYQVFDKSYGYLFNSYYETLGPRQPRPHRGLLTRPPLDNVLAYRRHVDEAMEQRFLAGNLSGSLEALVVLGLNHEQQHQELLLTDVLHLLAQNPLAPAYNQGLSELSASAADALNFVFFDGGLVETGAAPSDQFQAFTFDNEGPRHKIFLAPYHLATRLITNDEWLQFIAAGGYQQAEHWLAEGWTLIQEEGWTAPLYWRQKEDGSWASFTLGGERPVAGADPVTHVSFYEADAFARWKGMRLPTEAEWENAAQGLPVVGGFLNEDQLRPSPAPSGGALRQMFGDCWEWTASPYAPYPGFRTAPGAVGEYNGKFMINQMVLRGGSCATPLGHVRASYRNFFHPHQRWQFSGVRLASDGTPRGEVAPIIEGTFRHDVQEGLAKGQKSLPSKYFYDRAGSELFEAICELEEYYPTRAETALLGAIAGDLAAKIPEGAALVEFGSGASTKTRFLLDAAIGLEAYVPIDISPAALEAAAKALATDYPTLDIIPVTGDFTRTVRLPRALDHLPKVGFFPGSTIGNFAPEEAEAFLRGVKRQLGDGARLIIGVDMVKSVDVLVAAYDDAKGVTGDFNLNLLVRMNRELSGDFDLERFFHRAIWNAEESRIEMHIVSSVDQQVTVAGRTYAFKQGESIHTENSYKYRPEVFRRMAISAGWRVEAEWFAPPPSFGVFLLAS